MHGTIHAIYGAEKPRRHLGIMGDQQYGHAAAQCFQHIQNHVLCVDIHIDVGSSSSRISGCYQCARKHPLALSAGEIVKPAFSRFDKPTASNAPITCHGLLCGCGNDLDCRHPTAPSAHIIHPNGKQWIEVRVLRHIADGQTCVAGGHTQYLDAAFTGRTSPSSSLNSVVLPPPLGPTMVTNCPRRSC